jgi:cytochrome c5
VTAQHLIDEARLLLTRDDGLHRGVWPRAVALLARQALELAVDDALRRQAPGAERASIRARMLCLPSYVSTATAHDAHFLWGTLSRACHQHPYELAPTATELDDWLGGVEAVTERIAPSSSTATV